MITYKDISKIYTKEDVGYKLKEKYQKFIDSLDDDFYDSFTNELVHIFDFLPETLELNYQMSECLDFNSSTAGWFDALYKVLGKQKVDEIYKDLEWYDSDFLDNEIEMRLGEWYCNKYYKQDV